MTTMIAELYDALLAAGSPEDKARKAAETMAGYEGRFVRIEADIAELKRDVAEVKRDVAEVKRDLFLLKWMVGFVLAFQVALFIKLFLH
jgi:hypothetical protein